MHHINLQGTSYMCFTDNASITVIPSVWLTTIYIVILVIFIYVFADENITENCTT